VGKTKDPCEGRAGRFAWSSYHDRPHAAAEKPIEILSQFNVQKRNQR
jgi:hypothetical protein